MTKLWVRLTLGKTVTLLISINSVAKDKVKSIKKIVFIWNISLFATLALTCCLHSFYFFSNQAANQHTAHKLTRMVTQISSLRWQDNEIKIHQGNDVLRICAKPKHIVSVQSNIFLSLLPYLRNSFGAIYNSIAVVSHNIHCFINRGGSGV